MRVASAGYRIFKTSSSQNESGTIKAYYSDRGSYVNKNLAELIDYYQDDQAHARIYVASESGSDSGRTGYMIGAIYQPLNALECTDFVNARKVMLSDTSRLINGSYLELGQQGPIRFIF